MHLRVVGRQLIDGRHQAELVENARPQAAGEATDLVEGPRRHPAQLGHLLAHGVETRRFREGAEAHQEGGQRLPRLVVELPREAALLLLLGGGHLLEEPGADLGVPAALGDVVRDDGVAHEPALRDRARPW